jgi:hypothetical protein
MPDYCLVLGDGNSSDPLHVELVADEADSEEEAARQVREALEDFDVGGRGVEKSVRAFQDGSGDDTLWVDIQLRPGVRVHVGIDLSPGVVRDAAYQVLENHNVVREA